MQKSRNQRIKEFLLTLSDTIDRYCQASGDLVPPKRLSSQYGSGSHAEVGLEFFRHLLDHARLTRSSSVLDVGCGIGRVALPLTAYLGRDGRYEGFDVVRDGVEYCTRVFTPRFRNFSFAHADVFNSYYNPDGSTAPEDYRFVYPDDSFDVVVSTSVFTHLKPAAIEQYLRETHRVLKPGGVSLHTYFLLNARSRASIAAGNGWQGFRHEIDGFMTSDVEHPEAAVAVREEAVEAMYRRCGFGAPKIFNGDWSGIVEGVLSNQDIVVGSKATAS